MKTAFVQTDGAASDTEPVLWTVAEAAAATRLSGSLLYQMARRGELPGIALRVGRAVRFHRVRLLAWLDTLADDHAA